jgi:hypothetical protein
MPNKRHSAMIVGIALGSLIASSCSDANQTKETPEVSCVAKVQFEDRTYVERTNRDSDSIKQGQKLGVGRTVGCSESDAEGSGGPITIYRAIGYDPKQAVIAESPVGLLQNAAGAGG